MKIKTIDIQAKQWHDKVNGNSYFSGKVIVNYGMKNEKTFPMPFQYGYGEAYIQEAAAKLRDVGTEIPFYAFTRFCRENRIILRSNIEKNCLKRDVKAFGE